MDWQMLHIAELEHTSNVGQLMRKYETEMQRLQAQIDAERKDMQEQVMQARQQQLHTAMQLVTPEQVGQLVKLLNKQVMASCG